MSGVSMIEFEIGTSVRANEHHAMLVPISSVISVGPWPDTTEARLTLVDVHVLWIPEGYDSLGSAYSRGSAEPAMPDPTPSTTGPDA